jgi:hypothetical protein
VYYAFKGVFFSVDVVWFFVKWLTALGLVTWARDIVTGTVPITPMVIVGLTASLLTYPLYVWAILKYDRRPRPMTVLALLVLSPFWMIVMAIYVLSVGEWLRGKQHNRWVKDPNA